MKRISNSLEQSFLFLLQRRESHRRTVLHIESAIYQLQRWENAVLPSSPLGNRCTQTKKFWGVESWRKRICPSSIQPRVQSSALTGRKFPSVIWKDHSNWTRVREHSLSELIRQTHTVVAIQPIDCTPLQAGMDTRSDGVPCVQLTEYKSLENWSLCWSDGESSARYSEERSCGRGSLVSNFASRLKSIKLKSTSLPQSDSSSSFRPWYLV